MILEFKNREQIRNEKMEELKEFFTDKDFNRWIRIDRNKAVGNDRLAISNNFLELKFKLRNIYKYLDYCYEKRMEAKEELKSESIDIKLRLEYQEYISQIDNLIKTYKSQINALGDLIVNLYAPMLDKYFSKKEIVQLIGGSYEQIKRIDEYDKDDELRINSITESYILHHGEYRWRKGRSKDFVDCPSWEMPLFNCLSNYMLKVINDNPDTKRELDNKFEEMFSEHMVNIIFDESENIVEIEKLIQELSVRELIKDYKGKFINELKSGNIFNNKKYRVKRLEDNVYCVLDEDNKIIDKIYKKAS